MTKKIKSTPVSPNSGKRAREWRRRLAASSTKPAGSIRTIKFKLDYPDGLPITFEQVRGLNKIVDGIGAGSLTGLLLTVHGSGFRVFATEGETIQFRSRANSTSDFQQQFASESGFSFKGFDAAGLRKRFSKIPRSKGGKDVSFTSDIIAREYAREFAGNPPEKLDDDAANFFREWAELIHSEFCNEKDPWNAIDNNFARAVGTVDKLCVDRGWVLSLVANESSEGAAVAWKAATIAFDPNQPIHNLNSPVLLHQVISSYLKNARTSGKSKNIELRKYVQSALTTDTSSGLSWLFGNGLKQLKALGTINEIMDGLCVPETGRKSVEAIKAAADSIGDDEVFGAESFSNYRRIVGGRLDSWVANYLNRLFELESLLTSEPTPLNITPKFLELFPSLVGNSTLTLDDIQVAMSQAKVANASASLAVKRLLGVADEVAVQDDVIAVEYYASLINEAFGKLKTVDNYLTQLREDATNPVRQKAAIDVDFKIPEWLKDLPVINRLSGAIPDFETQLTEAAQLYAKLYRSREETVSKIKSWADDNGIKIDTYARLSQAEMDASKSRHRGSHGDHNSERLAIASILHRFGVASFGCSIAVRERVKSFYDQLGVFTKPKEANHFFINQKGALYRSAFSKSRHEPYEINWSNVENADVLKRVEGFVMALAAELRAGSNAIRTDIHRLEQSYYGLWLTGLSDDVPRDVASIDIPESAARCPVTLKTLMAEGMLSPDTVRRAFNLYHSALRGLEVILNRNSFFLRARVQRVGDTKLYYVPKPTLWAAPHRLWNVDKPISAMLNDVFIKYTDESRKIIDAAGTFSEFYKKPKKPTTSSAAYLTQAPHDWMYAPGFVNTGNAKLGISVDGKTGPAERAKTQNGIGRLVGPSAFKSELDRLLSRENGVTFGDITVIFDQEFKQVVDWSAEEKIGISITPLNLSVSIAIPLNEPAAPFDPIFILADKLVSIDQGEVGIGYAVYDIVSRNALAQGNVRIPSIRRLIKSAKRYRNVQQKSQKFQQRFDSTLFNMRENVVGDVCHAICTLMRKYKAFPVLEEQVRNLEGGSRQLDLVYKAVSTRFLYSDTDAHKTERTAYWQGGDRWEHPSLKKYEWKDNQRTEKLKPLSLFPGANGPTAGTSQACSKCKRNPIKSTSELAELNGEKLTVHDGGRITVKDGVIRLLSMPDDLKMRKEYKRRKQRMPLSVAIKSGRTTWNDLRPILRRNLRQPPLSMQSKDTSQSMYYCVYEGCGFIGHADENAALNIGRRFLEERVRV